MNERWVCKRCFTDNEETDSACQKCGLGRGAESATTDAGTWAPPGGTAQTDPGWRRWIRFWWIPALVIALGVGFFTNARRDNDGALASGGTVAVDDLRVGDCFNSEGEGEVADVQGVPCTEAHEYEVFALATYEGDGTFPPDEELDAIFMEVCEPAFESYVGAPYATSEIYGSMISPSEGSWATGDRSFTCLLFDIDDPALTESLAGAAR